MDEETRRAVLLRALDGMMGDARKERLRRLLGQKPANDNGAAAAEYEHRKRPDEEGEQDSR